jgi:lysyl-tRNA synthetase class 2
MLEILLESLALWKELIRWYEYFNKVSLSATFLFLYSCGFTSFQGELSVYVSSWVMLTKSLQPLPDKYHGLTDVSKRYRLRHLDMIVNPEVRNVFRARAKITSLIRQMLDSDSFLEVKATYLRNLELEKNWMARQIETPILNSQPGGADAKPFETYHNSLEMSLTLRIATELHLKRLVVGGFDR